MYSPGNTTINYVVERVVFEIIFHVSFNVIILHISFTVLHFKCKTILSAWLLWDACFNQYHYKRKV